MFIEELLNLGKYRTNITQDPLWQHFPLRTSYEEELDHDCNSQHERNYLVKGDQSSSIIPALKKSREEKRMRKLAKQSQLTDGWYGMKQQQSSNEAKNNYIMMKLKKYIDPKNPAKASEFSVMPKYYQMGTVVDGGGITHTYIFIKDTEGTVLKVPRGKKESSLVDSFLAYDEEKNFSRKKFGEIQATRQKDYKFNQKLSRLRKFSKRLKNK